MLKLRYHNLKNVVNNTRPFLSGLKLDSTVLGLGFTAPSPESLDRFRENPVIYKLRGIWY